MSELAAFSDDSEGDEAVWDSGEEISPKKEGY
jgi:hypothetical protein